MNIYHAHYRATDETGGGTAYDVSQHAPAEPSEEDNELDLTGLEETPEDQEADVTDEPEEEETSEAPTLDPTSIPDEVIASEHRRRSAHYQQEVNQAPVEPVTDPRLAQIVELSYTDPQKAEALRLEIATERAIQAIAPQLKPMVQRDAIAGTGLSDVGQKYIRETFAKEPGADVAAMLSHPTTRDVLVRAARQYEAENAPKAPRRTATFQSASSEAPAISAADLAAIREFEKETGDKVDKETLRLARAGGR